MTLLVSFFIKYSNIINILKFQERKEFKESAKLEEREELKGFKDVNNTKVSLDWASEPRCARQHHHSFIG